MNNYQNAFDDKFKEGLSYFFPQGIINYITEARKEYQEALRFAELAQKNGSSVDPDRMTKYELVQWYRKCQEYDPE